MEKVNLIDLLPKINEAFDKGKAFAFMPNGISMLPTIVGGRDPVTIKRPDGNLKKYDIILYRRKSGQFVLHRIIDVDEKGYILCGDNESRPEKYIRHDSVIGVVTAYEQDGNVVVAGSKKFFKDAKKRTRTRPFRHLLLGIRNRIICPIFGLKKK